MDRVRLVLVDELDEIIPDEADNLKRTVTGVVYKVIRKEDIYKTKSLKFLKSLDQKWNIQDAQFEDANQSSIDSPNRGPRDYSKNVFFKIRSTDGETLLCCSRTHFPVRKNDAIYGETEIVIIPSQSDQEPGGYYYQFTRAPLGLAGTSQKAFFDNLASFSRGKIVGKIAEKIYYQLIQEGTDRLKRGKTEVVLDDLTEVAFNQFSYLSENYRHASVEILDSMLGNFNGKIVKSILNRWYWYFLRRRLEILGVSRPSIREMNDLGYEMITIYNLVMKNAFTVLPLGIKEAITLKNVLGQTYTDRDQRVAVAARKAYSLVGKSRWSSVPETMMSEYITDLVDTYEMIHDLKSLYFPKQHQSEVTVARRIELAMKELPRYEGDVPFENRGTLKLTDQQKEAVIGAISNPVSIITGPAGTGKCLAPETPVLMFDGSIKAIKNIKAGEKVMGPDSKPRNVLSMASGKDEMYQIEPKFSKGFVCNAPHVLTLKGIKPTVQVNPESVKVIYTTKGKLKSKVFDREEEAIQFLSLLEDDIFDLSLNVYLTWSKSEQSNLQLFRVEVNFEKQDLHLNPFLMGRQVIKNDRIYDSEIPSIYKVNSKVNRQKLLAGMLEEYLYYENNKTDRNVIRVNGQKLGEDIEYLILSLGWWVTNTRVPKGGRTEQIIEFFKNPDLCSHKFTVTSIGKGNYCGFELDGDGRFLLGNFIVTHNTTIIEQLVENLDSRDVNYAIVAYTGKAVCRIEEGVRSSIKPMTIHRLCYGGWTKKKPFSHLIIDEASMLTVPLLAMIYNKFQHNFALTLVGDVNQLPPIEWGFIFDQILKSKLFPTYFLTNNLRVHSNGSKDGIVINCDKIAKIMEIRKTNAQASIRDLNFDFHLGDNFRMIPGSFKSVNLTLKRITDIGVRSKDIVIITPFNRHLPDLNRICQDHFILDKSQEVISNGRIFYRQDIVMMTRNNYPIKVMNGTTGEIILFSQEPSPIRHVFNDFIGNPAFGKTWGMKTKQRISRRNNRSHQTEVSGYIQVQFINGKTRRLLINKTDHNIYSWALDVAVGMECNLLQHSNGSAMNLSAFPEQGVTSGKKRKKRKKRADYYPVNSDQEWRAIMEVIERVDKYYRRYPKSPSNFCISTDFKPAIMKSWFEPLLKVKYPYGWAGDLTHGYAMTAHKAEGSEWHHVITYLGPEDKPSNFLNDRLLYTIFSRAQKSVNCVGNPNIYYISAVQPMRERYDQLAVRLKNLIET
uniref:RecD helicase /ATP-dependent exoDNAse n=1 Tax=Pithovirus LCPAC201 TaxID=2506591 RepID=A0A481Z6L9_9VIRU|nr:MAG: RecD helicase /ATP-dependent exoDNAse [Pithovirus LCPAC201]